MTCTKPAVETKHAHQHWCEDGPDTYEPHEKMVPQCTNVTKQNCVTKWEVDQQARRVYC